MLDGRDKKLIDTINNHYTKHDNYSIILPNIQLVIFFIYKQSVFVMEKVISEKFR